jgi:hypothetical protein
MFEGQSFVAVGVDSLSALEIRNQIKESFGDVYGKALPPNLLLMYPTLDEVVEFLLSEAIWTTPARSPTPAPVAPITASPGDTTAGRYPLTPFQERVHAIYESNPEDMSYNVSEVFKITGRLDIESFEKAINHIIKRHEIMRTVFRKSDGGVYQEILPTLDYQVALHRVDGDLETVAAQAFHEASRPFDLEAGPLFRFGLYTFSEELFILGTGFQHIIIDGMAWHLFEEELMRFYRAFAAGSLPLEAPPQFQYRHYATWARQQNFDQHREYWAHRLRDVPKTFRLPTDKPRRADKIDDYFGEWNIETFAMNMTVYRQLTEFARQAGCTPFAAMLAVIQLFLHEFCNEDRITICIPVTTRRTADQFAEVLGPIVSYLFYLGRIEPGVSFAQFMATTSKQFARDSQYEDFPFELLFETLWPERPKTFYPICHTFLNFVPRGKPYQLGTTHFESLRSDPGGGDSDLLFQMDELPNETRMIIHYNIYLYEKTTVFKIFARLERMIGIIVKNPHISLQDIVRELRAANPENKP